MACTPGKKAGRGWDRARADDLARERVDAPQPHLREYLGYALTPEETGYTATVQEFERGLILSSPNGRGLTVIVNTSAKCCTGGDFERFPVAAR